MSRSSMAASDRRALLVGIVVILPLTIAAKGLPAAVRWQTTYVERVRARIDADQRRADAERELPMLRHAWDTQRAALAASGSIISDRDAPSIAAAKLAAIVDSVASDAAVQVTSLELGADTVRHSSVAPIHVRLIGTCDVAGLMELMRSIEASRVPLAVRELSVNAADPASPDTRAEVLRIDVIVGSIAMRDARMANGASP